MIEWAALRRKLAGRFQLGGFSLHGPEHWRRVEENGILLARAADIDDTVVRLFAIFHDVERWNEGSDPEHGRRAARLVRSLHGKEFELVESHLLILAEACSYHNDGYTSHDPVIGCCWDADRLDLPRVGITPRVELMSTTLGREMAGTI